MAQAAQSAHARGWGGPEAGPRGEALLGLPLPRFPFGVALGECSLRVPVNPPIPQVFFRVARLQACASGAFWQTSHSTRVGLSTGPTWSPSCRDPSSVHYGGDPVSGHPDRQPIVDQALCHPTPPLVMFGVRPPFTKGKTRCTRSIRKEVDTCLQCPALNMS